MRIIRNFDNHDDDHDHDAHDHGHGVGEPAQDPARLAEILADETEAWLAGLATENPYTPGQAPTPTEPGRDKPVLRLVKQVTGNTEPPVPVEDGHLIPVMRPTPPAPGPARPAVPAWVRGAVPGSAVVVIVALVLAEGQPPTVAAPIGVYATGWVAYLAWNTAHRPPLGQVVTTAFAGFVRLLAAITGGTARTIRAGVDRIDNARRRTESARTATN